MTALGYVTVFVVSLFVSAIVSGWTLSILWGWFIVTKFGLPALTIAEAVGVSLVVGCFKHISTRKDERPFLEIVGVGLSALLMWAGLALAAGFIVRQWTV